MFQRTRYHQRSLASLALLGMFVLALPSGAWCQCCPLEPRWLAQGSFIAMDRVTSDCRVLMENTTNRAQQLDADAFDFDWASGFDLSLMRIAWDDHAWELRFLVLDELKATERVESNGGLLQINSTPPIFAPDVNSIDSRYTTDLYGVELNYHYVTYWPVNYICGFRYVGLDDDLTAIMDAAPQTFRFRTTTRNDLYGFQLGLTSVRDKPLLADCHWLTWFVKVGVFGNDAKQRTLFDTGVVGQPAKDTADSVAFVGEFGLGADLPLREWLTLRGGYRLMVFDRVAIADRQLRSIDFFTGQGSDDRGQPVFHGANFGIELMF